MMVQEWYRCHPSFRHAAQLLGTVVLLLLVGFGVRAHSSFASGPSRTSDSLPKNWSAVGPISEHWSPEPYAEVVASSQGDAYVLWVENAGTTNNRPTSVLYVRQRTRAGKWLPREQINSNPQQQDIRFPQIAVDERGNLYALWFEDQAADASADFHLVFREKPVGGPWSTTQILCQSCGARYQLPPELTVSSQGHLLVFWANMDLSGDSILTRERPRGGSWQAPEKAYSGVAEHQSISSIKAAIDEKGNRYLIWSAGSTTHLYGAHRPVGGTWQPMALTGMASPSFYENGHDLIITPDGILHAVWAGYVDDTLGGTEARVFYSRRQLDGTWTTAQLISRQIRRGEDCGNPTIATNRSGTLVAAWVCDLLHVAYQPAGGVWSASQTLLAGFQPPDIGLDPSENAYLVLYSLYGLNFAMTAPVYQGQYRVNKIATSAEEILAYQLDLENTLPFTNTLVVTGTIPADTTYREGTLTVSHGSVQWEGSRFVWHAEPAPNTPLRATFQLQVNATLPDTTRVLLSEVQVEGSPQAPVSMVAATYIEPYQIYLPLAR